MRKWFLLLSISFLLLACSDNDDDFKAIAACGFENVTEELSWLKAEIERREESSSEDLIYCYITISEIDGESVFIYRDCNPLIDKACCPIYDCNGNLLPYDKISLVSNERIIWKSKDFACTIN